jgi:hypothetical protein
MRLADGRDRMYFWNAKQLAEDLRDGRVDEKERFKYFIGTFAVWTMIGSLRIYAALPLRVENLTSLIIDLSVTIIGLFLCYKVNRSGDREDFAARLVCLAWSWSLRFAVYVAALVMFMGFDLKLVSTFLGPGSYTTTNWFLKGLRFLWGPGFGMFVILPYYLQISKSLAHVAQGKPYASYLQMMKTESPVQTALGLICAINVIVMLILWLALIPHFVLPGRVGSLSDLLPVTLLWVGVCIIVLRRRRAMK